jgi:hypothetical protein
MKDSKNQIIRSMKSYETGGSSDDSCMETVMVDGWPKRRRRPKCGKTKTFRVRSAGEKLGLGAKIIAGVGTLGLGVAELTNKTVSNMFNKKQKKGGIIKTKK